MNSERLVIPVLLRTKNVDIRINSSLRHHSRRDLAEIPFLDPFVTVDNGGGVYVVVWKEKGAQDRRERNRRTIKKKKGAE